MFRSRYRKGMGGAASRTSTAWQQHEAAQGCTLPKASNFRSVAHPSDPIKLAPDRRPRRTPLACTAHRSPRQLLVGRAPTAGGIPCEWRSQQRQPDRPSQLCSVTSSTASRELLWFCQRANSCDLGVGTCMHTIWRARGACVAARTGLFSRGCAGSLLCSAAASRCA